jgi:hypothetical protein
MKTRNRIIIVLLAFGIALFAAIEFFVIPHQNAENTKYAAAQQEPSTHDLNTILKYRNKYMGNFSNTINLFYHLPLSNAGMNFQLYPDTLTLEVNYKDTVWNIGKEKVNRSLIYNSTAAFALIDNLQSIVYNFPGETYRVNRADVEKLYSNFSTIIQKVNWYKYVQEPLKNLQYTDDTAEKVIKKP